MPSNEAHQAIVNMRLSLEAAERFRRMVIRRREKVKELQTERYLKEKRETFGALDLVTTRIANNDQLARDMIEDEQFYRGLTIMYAEVARAELALNEAEQREQSSSIRNVSAPRTQ